MGITKFELWIDGCCVAKDIELETAMAICEHHINKYYRESEFEFIIKTANYGKEEVE